MIDINSKEVGDVLDEASDLRNEGETKYAGLSYEDGVVSAIEWLRGFTDSNPMEE